MQHLSISGSVSRVVHSLPVAPVALAGFAGLSLAATLFTAAPAADAAPASWLYYQRGYYLDNGSLCYGRSNAAYHCTHHWHSADGRHTSDNLTWVPNHDTASSSAGASTTHTASSGSTQTPSTPAYSGGSVQSMIESVFGPYAGQALSVAQCESGFNPTAYNPIWVGNSHAEGVFQILYPSTWYGTSYSGYSPYNAWANIHAAYEIFARDGFSWSEWVCR